MTEITAFQALPIVLVNIILDWCRSPLQTWYIKVDEKTGKLCLLFNVQLAVKLILANKRNPLLMFTNIRGTYWMEYSKPVTIYIDGEVIPALEHCLKIKREYSRFHDDEYPELYIEYERKQKMEYLQCYGDCYGVDRTNPQVFYSCVLHRFDESKGQYFTQAVNLNHVGNQNDYTRQITLLGHSIEYFHYCKDISNEYLRRRMTDRYAKTTMLSEMGNNPDNQEKMTTAISLIEDTFNQYSGMYE